MKRRSRFARTENLPGFRLTSRDVEIIECVARNRLLTRSQIQREFFGSDSTANFRLQKLWLHGYLDRPVSHNRGGITQDTIYTVTRLGLQQIEFATGKKPERRRASSANPNQIEHDLTIADIRMQIERSARTHQLGITWRGEDAMRGKPYRVLVQGKQRSLVPDGFAKIETATAIFFFFIEYDRGTEAPVRIQEKLITYDRFILSNEYSTRLETHYPARVLFVSRDDSKLKGLQAIAAKMRSPQYFHFASLSAVLGEDPLKAGIWQTNDRPGIALF